jgi:ABC-2 type transport system ATP-binding protein
LDEPTAGLDPAQIAQIRELLRSLAGKHTIILSSHILSEISHVCAQIIIISNGRVAAQESAKTLLEDEHVFLLTLKAKNTAGALSCVSAVPGIVTASVVDTATAVSTTDAVAESEGRCCLRVKFEGGDDTKEALFHALAAAKLPILELVTERRSLEQVFLQATI